MKKYNKRGISLIVLIITIIVMIILAAAIILSISNSGIMDKANKAKTESDTANLKEYANVLEAEWELGTKETSKEVYVNTKLEEKGYTGALFMEDGTLYTNLQSNAKAALEAGIQIGDVVKYEVTSKTVKSLSKDNGSSTQTLSNSTSETWIYIGISENGELLITTDFSSAGPFVSLGGSSAISYLNGPNELNRICNVLYSSDKGTARSMDINDVNRLLGYTPPKSKTVAEEVEEKGYNMNTFTDYDSDFGPCVVPDEKIALGDYVVCNYIIGKEEALNMKASNIDLVFPTEGGYWLASSDVTLGYLRVYFAVLYVNSGDGYISDSSGIVMSNATFTSRGEYASATMPVRPVVSLTSNIQKSTENGSTVWTF